MDNEKLQIVYQPRIAISTYPLIFPNRYTISDNGIVTDLHPRIPNSWQTLYSNDPKVLRPFVLDSNNIVYVTLKNNIDGKCRMNVARLVAWEFVPENRKLKHKVICKDGNNYNLHYTNLMWVSSSKFLAIRRKEKKFNLDSYQDKTNNELLKIQKMFTS